MIARSLFIESGATAVSKKATKSIGEDFMSASLETADKSGYFSKLFFRSWLLIELYIVQCNLWNLSLLDDLAATW